MDFLEDIGKIVEETGHKVERKAKKLAETARLKNMVRTCEEVAEKNYREIGKAYYEANKEKETCVYAVQCKAISDALKGADMLREKLKKEQEEKEESEAGYR